MENQPQLKVGDVNFEQVTRFVGPGRICCGNDITFGWRHSPGLCSTESYLEVRNPSAYIQIDGGSIFNNGCSLIATERISIGRRCFFGAECLIVDSDFHGITIRGRNDSKCIRSSPVNIGDDCWLGNRVMVLKGVTLGSGCVVAAGAVVTKSFPANSLIAGVPARFIKTINQEM